MKGRLLWKEQSPRLIGMYYRMKARLQYEQRQWDAAIHGVKLEDPEWDDEQAKIEEQNQIKKYKEFQVWKAKKRAEGTLIDPRNIDALLKSGKGKVIGINIHNADKLEKELKKVV